MQKNVVDAGPLVAYFLDQEESHEWAVKIFSRHPFFHTCEAVLAEACSRLAYHGDKPAKILSMVESGTLKIDFRAGDKASRIVRLMEKYADLPMDFADACLVVMSEDTRNSMVYTLDANDFSVYRRHGRDVVPFLSPQK